MIRLFSGAILVGLLCIAAEARTPAVAQSTTSGAVAGSNSGATAGAGASSGSAAVITQNWNSPAEQRVLYGGGYSTSSTIRNTPDAHAPAIFGGANPCVVGASAGGSVAGFGLSLGLSRNDPGCERRNLAVLAHQMGRPALAQEILCGSEDVRAARARLGEPCLADTAPSQQPVVSWRPNSVTEVRAPATTQVLATARMMPVARPDWCDTASLMERRTRSVCN